MTPLPLRALAAALLLASAAAAAAPVTGGASSCGAVPPLWAADVSGGGGGGGGGGGTGLSDAEGSRLLEALCKKLMCGHVVFVLARSDLTTELKTRRLLRELSLPYISVPAESAQLVPVVRAHHYMPPIFVAVATSGTTTVPKDLRPLREVWLMMAPPAFAFAVPAPFESLVLQVCHVGRRCVLLRERYAVWEGAAARGGVVACYRRRASPPAVDWVPVMWIDRRTTLAGARLRVLVQHEPPFAEYIDKRQVTGFFGGLWRILEERMNFSSDLERVQGDECGCGASCSLLRRLSEGSVDAALGAIPMTPEKADKASLLLPVLTVRYSVYIRALPTLSADASSFLVPFSPRLWLALVATVACSSLALTLNCRLGRHRRRNHGCRCSLADALVGVYGVICAQGIHETQCMHGVGRMVLAGVLAVATTVPAAYSAVLVSLAVHSPELPFSDLPGLLRHGGYSVGVLRNSTEHRFFSTTSDPTMQLLYNKLMEPDPENFPATDAEAFQRVCEKKFAYLIPQEYSYALSDNISCSVVSLPTTHFHLSLTIALAKNTTYKSLFNHNIQVLRRNGIIQKLYREWWPHREYEQDDPWEAVDIDKVVSPFGVLLLGIFLASIVGAAEFCWHMKWKRSSTHHRKNRLSLQMINGSLKLKL